MGAASTNLLLGPGRLILNPADLVTTPDFGGTRLGTVQDVQVEVTDITYPVRALEQGGRICQQVRLYETVVVSWTTQNWDEDAVAASLQNASTNSGVPTVSYPGTGTAKSGKLTPDRVLFFVPNDDTQPAALFYAAMSWRITSPIRFSSILPTELRVEWRCREDSSGRVYNSDLVSRLAL